MDYGLERAGPGDAEWLEALRRTVYEDLFVATWGGWDEERHKRHWAASWGVGHIQLVKVQGEPVGMLQLFEEGDCLEVGEVQILPSFQGRGLGSQLIRNVMEKAQSTGKRVSLSTGLRNEGAARLYERLGFRRVGESETHVHLEWNPNRA